MGPRKARWWAWHQKNPHIYELFKRFTFEAIEAGQEQSGAWLIVGRIRWETAVVTRGEDFKISNDFIAYYARHFMAEFPEHRGFFKIKRMKPDV
jgi:hypothetical protein